MLSVLQNVHVNAVLPDLEAASGKEVLQTLAMEIANHTDMDARSIYHKLSEAENVQSSGIGGGVSIPHLQLSDLKAPITILARLKNPLDFQAADQQLIDLVCLLVSPAEEGTRHLQRLARISRTFKDELLCSSLRAAKNAREMQIMVNANTSEERLLAA